MAVGAMRLIPKLVGARILLSGALSLVVCLTLDICQDHIFRKQLNLRYDPQKLRSRALQKR